MPEKPTIKRKNRHAVALGKKGGLARREALTPERRIEIARAAINARWHPAGVPEKRKRKVK